MKYVRMLGCVMATLCAMASVGRAGDWTKLTDVKTEGTPTQSPGEAENDVATAEGEGGEWWIDVACYPSDCQDGEDSSSASITSSHWQQKWVTYDCVAEDPATFDFEVRMRQAWYVFGNASNGAEGPGACEATAYSFVTVDSEPDDADTQPAYTNFWDGHKIEGQSGVSGMGIEVWSTSLAWDFTGDYWDDSNVDGSPKVWLGTISNIDGGTYRDSVHIRVYSSGQAECSGANFAAAAGAIIGTYIDTFTLTWNED